MSTAVDTQSFAATEARREALGGRAPADRADTRVLCSNLRVAIAEEFGERARPLEAVLCELSEHAEAIEACEGDERRALLASLDPMLDRIEDLLDVLRMGGRS